MVAAAAPAASAAAAAPGAANLRDNALKAASAALTAARRAAPDEAMVSVGLAQLALARGNPADARRELERGLGRRAGSGSASPSAAPHLALADLLLPTDPAGAASHYGRALRLVGGDGGDAGAAHHARLGLGAAHYRAGRGPAARVAWERALDVASGGAYAAAAATAGADPTVAADPATWAPSAASAPPAMVGLAALDLASPGATRRARGAARLAAAFAADPARPATLCLLSRQALVMGDTDKASALAKAAILAAGSGAGGGGPTSASGSALKAAAATAAARSHHAAGELLPALRAYRGASAVDAGAPLPILGLAQLTALQEGSVANAAATAERALERAPGWGAALRLLAPLYAHGAGARGGGGPGSTALPHFRAAAAKPGAEAEDHEALGELLARRGDARGAAGAYRAALAAARASAAAKAGDAANLSPLPGRLLNNAAVAAFRVGDVRGAAALLDEALAGGAGAAGAGAALAPASALTVGYNRARVLEAVAGPAAAAGEHAAIAAAFPGYADCQVRLASLAAARGDLRACAAAVDAALAADPAAADAPAVLGRDLLSRRRWAESEAAFRRVDEAVRAGRAARAAAATAGGRPPDPADAPDAGPDPYAACGRAALLLHSAPSALSTRPGDASKRASHLRRAADAFTRVLKAHPKCAAAAAGLAAAMAEAGSIEPARDVLLAVHEAASAAGGALEAPDAAVNLAHAHLAEGRPGAAVRLYEAASRAPPGPGGSGSDPADRAAGLAVILGRALYEDGKFADARRALAAGLRARPSDDLLRFNLGVVLETGGVRALRHPRPPGDPAALRCLEAGVEEVALASRLFAALGTTAGTRRPPPGSMGPPLEAPRLAMHVAFCEEWASKAAPLLAAARLDAEARAARAAQSAAAHAASVQRAAVEAEVAAAESAAARAAREAAAREAAARLEALRGQWAHNEAVAKAAEKGDAAAVDAARRAAKAAAEADAVFEDGGSSDDDGQDYAPGAAEEAAAARDDDDDSEMEEAGGAGGGGGSGGAKRPAEAAPDDDGAAPAPSKRARALESEEDEPAPDAPPAGGAAPAVDTAALFGSDSE